MNSFRGILVSFFVGLATAGGEQIVFTEINYNPGDGKPEFIEVTNNTVTPFAIANWKMSNGVAFNFPGFDAKSPQASILQAFETILLTEVTPSTFRSAYPNTAADVRIFGPWSGKLSNGGERITLEDKNGVPRASVRYGDSHPKWPIAADGGEHTLTLRNANRPNDDYRNWRASNRRHGSPGIAKETPRPRQLSISEVAFDASGAISWIELQNLDLDLPRPLAGFSLAIDSLENRQELVGSVPSGGLLTISTDFSDLGDFTTIYLLNGDDDVLDAVRLQVPTVASSYQAWPIGSDEFYLTATPSRNSPNNPERPRSIVINEIMYDAPSDHRSAEFIELFNRGPETVDLGGWRFREGVRFKFPTPTRLESGQYLVIAGDADYFQESYPDVAVAGEFEGQLADSGELLRLEDASGNLADEVHYLPEGDWPELADGDGSSMELRHPDMDNTQASAWLDSDESTKAQNKRYTITGEYIRTANNPADQELHFHLVGDAYAIIENVSVTANGNLRNLIRNRDRESPSSNSDQGWVSQGTHWASHLKPDRSLHLISDGHGDSKLNRTEIDLGDVALGDDLTIEFDARWIHGKPRLIAQTNNRSVGQAVLLPIPTDLGTPGARNSRALDRAAPVISSLLHQPAVPKANEPVTVTAKVNSATPLATVELVYRLDNINGDGPWRRVAMRPDPAGPGYSAVVPTFRANGNLVQFYVEGSTPDGDHTTLPKLGAERPAMYIVDSSDKRSDLLTQRFLISEYHRSSIAGAGAGAKFRSKFPLMSNHYFNATFIANEEEIYYNAEIRNSGSIFTREGNLEHGKWKLPGDRLFRNRRKSVIDPSTSYHDRMARFLLYQLGHPINENEWVKVIINAGPAALREDMEPVATDFIKRNFAGGNRGTLLRIDDELSFSDAGNGGRLRDADWVYKDSDNPIRYHTEWLMRSQETRYDYTAFIQWLKTLERDNLALGVLDRQLDRDLVCINAAVRGYVADVDSFTLSRGKNGYFYQKPDGLWMLLQWDGDRTFGHANAGFLGGVPRVNTYFRVPGVRRTLQYWLRELHGHHTLNSSFTQAWLDAEERATPSHSVAKATYNSWFSHRAPAVESFVGEAWNAPLSVSEITHPAPGRVTLTGTAGADVYALEIEGHPAVEVRWTGVSEWIAEGIPVAKGTHPLTVLGLSHQGARRASTTASVTSDKGAPPVAILSTTPGSQRIGLGEEIVIDAQASYDPDGTPLKFRWIPPSGISAFESENVGLARAVFNAPGIHRVQVTITDALGEATSAETEITVYGENGFSSFTPNRLAPFWSAENVVLPGHSPSHPWYSLQERSGQLVIQIPDQEAHPLGVPLPPPPPAVEIFSFDHPWKFDDSNTDLGNAGWTDMEYDDTGWNSGAGLLGFELSDLGEPLRTPLRRDRQGGLLTYYLRTEFEFNGDPTGARLHLDHYADDGVVYYLNGEEIGRTGFSVDEINHNTPADRPVLPNATLEIDAVVAEGTKLRHGVNVLAAELHNESAGSSDAVLGVRLGIASYANLDLSRDFLEQPWITRPLPPINDWTLDTKVNLETVQFGDFLAGLQVEGSANGKAFRFTLGYEDGNRISVFRSNGNGTVRMGSMEDDQASKVELRIARIGDELSFAWLSSQGWQEVVRAPIEGALFAKGGPVVATEEPLSLRVAFDYVTLIEPIPHPDRSFFANWMEENGFNDPQADPDRNGLNRLLTFALGADLLEDRNEAHPRVLFRDGKLALRYTIRNGSDTRISVESSSDLKHWQDTDTALISRIDNGDGTSTILVHPTDKDALFLRLRVSLPDQ